MNDVAKVEAICARIAPLLQGQGPAIQGAVLAELLSMWLAGHPEELRPQMLAMHLEHMRPLVDINAKLIRDE